MKKVLFYFLLPTILFSCEDVIDVDLPEEEPRLLVDAILRIDTSSDIQRVTVKLSETSSFFEEIAPINQDQLDTFFLTNLDFTATAETPNLISFSEVSPGIYEGTNNSDFFTNGRLVLVLSYDGQTYVAQTNYVPAAPIDELVQGDGILFNEDDTEVIITFTDNANRDDFYIFDFDFSEFLVSEDTFYKDQQFEFSYFYDKNLQPGQEVEISILGADRTFFNYMNQIINQSDGSFGPFGIPAATVRGNIANVTGIMITDIEDLDNALLPSNINALNTAENNANFALGYFAVTQEFTERITIE